MIKRQKNSTPAKKIKRERKRLYESLPEDNITEAEVNAREDSLVTHKQSKITGANKIINSYVLWSAGTALIPLPFVDMVAVMAIELRMLQKLCSHYEIRFSSQKAKALAAAMIGGLHAGLFYRSLLKMVPVIGINGVVVSMAALAGALTYAVGKVFVQHFETGGTLLDFDSSKVEAFFKKKLEEGRKVVQDLIKTGKNKTVVDESQP